MDQNIPSINNVNDVLEAANSLHRQMEDLLESIERIQASMRRDDELRM